MITLRLSRWPRRSRGVPLGRAICRARWAEVRNRSRLRKGPSRHLVEQGLGWSDSRVDLHRHSNSLDCKLRLRDISRRYHVNGSRPTYMF